METEQCYRPLPALPHISDISCKLWVLQWPSEGKPCEMKKMIVGPDQRPVATGTVCLNMYECHWLGLGLGQVTASAEGRNKYVRK